MNKDKQIEEMAKIACNVCATDLGRCSVIVKGEVCEAVCKEAEAFYNAGYCKASDIFAEIESIAHDGAIGGKYPVKVIDPDKFAELKKKYEATNNG